MGRPARWGAGAVAVGLIATVTVANSSTTRAVDTDMAISTTAIDFGSVNVGATASASVTLTNTGSDPFGPINMFGGAPPSAEFNASQNCQATTLPAGGSCMVNYSFLPGSVGVFNDVSSFTVSETSSQSDGEDFTVSLTGVGVDPGALATTTTETTTSTTSTTSTSELTTTTTEPQATTTAAQNGTSPASSAPGPTSPPATTSTTAPTTTTTVPTAETWPLTGLGVTPRPALVVKIDNVDAEPQSGLNQADIVFEQIVEGRATRFAAVFNSMEHNPVGPIRSARTQDVDLLLGLNDPALAYSGANGQVNEALAAAGLELLTEGDAGFFRNPGLPAPHNLFANLSTLFPQLTTSGDATPMFEHAPVGQDLGGTPVSTVSMMVGSYDVRWDWDANQGLFLRSQLGSPHEVTDGQASADSVVVLVVQYGASPVDAGPEAQSTGSGRAVVYTEGRRIEGTWTRATPTDPFTLTSADGPILVAPGRTWVELVDADNQLTDQ